MKKNYFIMILVGISLLVISSCKKKTKTKKPWTHTKKRLNLVEPVPYCMEKKIRFLEKYREPKDETGVWRWTMKDGTTYYYVYRERGHSCRDCSDLVYDINCEEYCGFATDISGYDGICEGLISDIEEEVLLWKSFDF